MSRGSWNGIILGLLSVAAVLIMALFANQVLPGLFANEPAEKAATTPSPRADDHFLGNEKAAADMTIIEFADLECPYCLTAGIEARKLVEENPEAKLVWKDCPLPYHPNAEGAAVAARCAGEQGKFWEFKDLLTSSGGMLGPELYASAAQGLGLDAVRFEACLADGAQAARVRASLAECAEAGVTDLPWFVLDGETFSGGSAVSRLKTALESK
jgi:protein-disulfide isomerase